MVNSIVIEAEKNFNTRILKDNVLSDFEHEEIENIPRVKRILKKKSIEDFLLIVNYAQTAEHKEVHDDICKYTVFGTTKNGEKEYLDEFPFWNNSRIQRLPKKHSDFIIARYLFIKQEYIEPAFTHIKWKETSKYRSRRTQEMIDVLTELFNPLGTEAVFLEEWELYTIPRFENIKKNETQIKPAHEFTYKQFDSIIKKIGNYLTVHFYQTNNNEDLDKYIIQNHKKATYALKNINSLVHKLF